MKIRYSLTSKVQRLNLECAYTLLVINNMTGEYITYNGIKNSPKLNVEKSLELQRWIIDPSSRSYPTAAPGNRDQKLIARSAAKTVSEKPQRLTVEKSLELQRKILDGLY